MKLPKEKITAALAVVKVVIAGYGVFASVRNLVDSVREVKTGRSRKVLYVDAGNIPPEKVDDYLAEADRYLRASRGSRDMTCCEAVDEEPKNGYASATLRRKTRRQSGYAGRTRVRKS